MDRRAFLQSTAMVSAATAFAPRGAVAAAGGMKKAVVIYMLGDKGPYADRLKMARDAGFDGIEAQTVTDPRVADEIRAAAAKTGIDIHSVMNMAHWRYPLSSADPEEVKQSVAGMEASLRNAKLWGANTVLLVPAVVNPKTGYRDAWVRSQKVIRERILPLAEELKIVIGIEEVWNKFLLSPIEFGEYVDSFKSPWIRAYLDVGNMLFYGYPQDWIRTLGKRIVKVHVKDFMLDRSGGKFYWKNLGEGDVDWPEVRKALGEIGYQGYITAEIDAGDAAYLKDVAGRMDRIIAGQAPVAG